jgi:hypothetical protein
MTNKIQSLQLACLILRHHEAIGEHPPLLGRRCREPDVLDVGACDRLAGLPRREAEAVTIKGGGLPDWARSGKVIIADLSRVYIPCGCLSWQPARPVRGRFFSSIPVDSRTAFSLQGCSTTGTLARFLRIKFFHGELGVSMSTLQNRSATTLKTRLLVIVRNLELQLHELHKLRYRVRQAERSARKSRRIGNGIRERNKTTLRQAPKPRCAVRTEPSRGRSA